MTKRTIALVLILPAIFIIACSIWYISNPKACPLPDYSWYHGYVDDLLILEGGCVVPTAIEAIRDRNLPKRAHFIFFLGNGRYKEALEPLVKIVEDESDPLRGVALIDVFRIDNEKGRELAKKYQTEEGDLGKYSQDILANKDYLHERKTYLKAWRNYIDEKYAL